MAETKAQREQRKAEEQIRANENLSWRQNLDAPTATELLQQQLVTNTTAVESIEELVRTEPDEKKEGSK